MKHVCLLTEKTKWVGEEHFSLNVFQIFTCMFSADSKAKELKDVIQF